MIDNYVKDSENVISIYLTSSGIGDAILEKNISLYVGSYQNKLLNVLVPKSLVYENEENTFNYAVSVSAIMTSDTGKKVTTKPYYLSYLKEVSLLDPQTQEEVQYIVLERIMPKEFCVYVGTTTIIVNVVNLDNTDDPTMIDITTSQTCYLQVQESDYADEKEVVEPSEFENLVSRITSLERQIDELDNVVSLGENFVVSLSGDVLPTNEELDEQVQNVEGRPPRNGDVIIFTWQIENETDKSYKYIYGAIGWENWQIPAVESASNGTLGLVQGTYSINDKDVTTTEVNVRNGKILNVYVGLQGEKQELGKIFNETLPNVYLNKEIGASKQFVRDYAMPRQFNDVDFIVTSGYQDNVPTEPANGVQFSITTNDVGDYEIFQIEKTNTADFELSSKNGYNNNIYISASANCKVTFRLTTKYKKEGQEWSNLNIELSNAVEYNANDIQKVVFSNPFTYLGDEVIEFTNGDKIQQTLEVITQTSIPITFNVYSNEIYPSTFTLTSQSYTMSSNIENIGKLLVLGVDGIIEGNNVVFEVKNAEDFVEYRTNQREFLIFGYLPVVGKIDNSLPVKIAFGDNTYNVYTFMNGGNNPITIGDLKSVMSYNQETGYRFYPKMMFIETADIQGFVVEPSTITASQLINVIDDSDTIVVGMNDNKVQLHLGAEVVNKLSRTLVTPMSAPASIELVGVGTDKMQVMIELGDGLVIENGVLKATGSGVDLTNYVTTNTAQEITGEKKFKSSGLLMWFSNVYKSDTGSILPVIRHNNGLSEFNQILQNKSGTIALLEDIDETNKANSDASNLTDANVESWISKLDILNSIYPKGSYFICETGTGSPASKYGGTWTQIATNVTIPFGNIAPVKTNASDVVTGTQSRVNLRYTSGGSVSTSHYLMAYDGGLYNARTTPNEAVAGIYFSNLVAEAQSSLTGVDIWWRDA